jgi:hypothetical protein
MTAVARRRLPASTRYSTGWNPRTIWRRSTTRGQTCVVRGRFVQGNSIFPAISSGSPPRASRWPFSVRLIVSLSTLPLAAVIDGEPGQRPTGQTSTGSTCRGCARSAAGTRAAALRSGNPQVVRRLPTPLSTTGPSSHRRSPSRRYASGSRRRSPLAPVDALVGSGAFDMVGRLTGLADRGRRTRSVAPCWGRPDCRLAMSQGILRWPATVVMSVAAGRTRDQTSHGSSADTLTRANHATAVSPDKGEVAGSIPASPTLPSRGKYP